MPSYRIPQPRIVYEILNTEVIAIDFQTGNYYVLAHVAKQIWQLIEQGMSQHQIARLLTSHYTREIDLVSTEVDLFIKQLLNEGLIELSDTVNEALDAAIVPHGFEYNPPKIQEYTDVQSLLLLDPIHEVSEVGWPDKL